MSGKQVRQKKRTVITNRASGNTENNEAQDFSKARKNEGSRNRKRENEDAQRGEYRGTEESEVEVNCRVGSLNKEVELSMHGQALNTKLCKAISNVLGDDASDELIALDILRQQLKDCGPSTSSTNTQYRKLLATFKQRLLDQRSTDRSNIKRFENTYYNAHYRLSTRDNP